MTNVSIRNLGKGTQFSNHLNNTLIFLFIFCLNHTAWVPKLEPQFLHFIFPLISLFIFFLMELRGCGIEPPQNYLFFIFIAFKFLSFGRLVVGSNPHNPSLISLNFSPLICLGGRGFDSLSRPESGPRLAPTLTVLCE